MSLVIGQHPWVSIQGRRFTLTMPAEPSDELVQYYADVVDLFYPDNERPFVWVVDGTLVRRNSATQRQILAGILKRHTKHLATYCAGMAFVVPNAFVRGAITAVFWLAPPSYLTTVVATLKQANAWAEARLTGSTISQPEP